MGVYDGMCVYGTDAVDKSAYGKCLCERHGGLGVREPNRCGGQVRMEMYVILAGEPQWVVTTIYTRII